MSGPQQPLWLKPEDVPALPHGWRAMSTADACIQLKPGKLFDAKTVQSSGRVPVLNQSASGFIGYHDEAPGVEATRARPVVTFANHTCEVRLMRQSFSCIQNIFPKIGKPDVTETEWFFYAVQGRVSLADYKGHHPLFRQAIIPVPPLPTQRRIASILGAYDDLIEVNRRRIAVLEEVARRLFEEWFVHYRFPGYEGMAMVEAAGRPLPDGWALRPVGSYGVVITGKTPSKANPDYYGNDVPFVKTPDMHGRMFVDSTDECLSMAGAATQRNKMLPPGSLLVSCIGTVGVVAVSTTMCQTNQQINSVVLSESASLEFLYFSLREAKQTLENLGANGATMANVNKSKFEALAVVSPPDHLIKQFHEYSEPMFSQIRSLSRATTALATARDLLLPRLISGDVPVYAAERELEAVA